MDSEGAESSCITSSVTPSTSRVSLAAKQRDCRRAAATTPPFLSNLGKATLRGIRRCPQCGVFNGTRGISCKNKACGVSLRNASGAAKSSKRSALEVVRLITDAEDKGGKSQEDGGVLGGGPGGGAEVFSVCHRGRGGGATQWGFVELVPTDTAIATGDGTTLLTRINLGRCFLPSCKQGQRLNQREGEPAGVKPSSDSLCVHIRQAIECQSRATPLTLKSSVLDSLQVSAELREELWRLAIFSPGPLVQQVSKDTLVVKCQTDSQHPLGLLHFSVSSACPSEASKGERSVFHCACQVGARRSKPGADGAAREHPACPTPSQPCLHFYACVCAFASSKKLTSEFSAFLNASSSSCGVPLKPSVTSNSEEKVLLQPDTRPPLPKALKICLDESSSGRAPPAVWKEGASASGQRKAAGRKAGGVKAAGSPQVTDECALTMSFQQWLAGVTERIHQTMHYQFDGRPEPLVYHIPQEFFNALQQRLSLGSKKRRLPNFTTAFLRPDGAPAGSFSKYTWHITNLQQVKRIFDTPELPLEITQSFVKNADGSYSRFRCPDPQPKQEPPDRPRADRPQAIRPMELRTFLKVGPAEQKEASPFVIEWIPDVLPRCRMGELRIGFEFGHQQSGQPDHGDRKGTAEKGGGKPDFNQANGKQAAAEILQVV